MEDHVELIEEASNYITALIYQLGNSYDELYGKDVETTELATAIDGLTFINEQLREQQKKLSEYKKNTLSKVTETK